MTADINHMLINNLHQHILCFAAATVQISLPIIMDVLLSITADDMATSEAVKPQGKKWSDQEAGDLIDFLCKCHSEATSPGNFKTAAWTAAKLHLDGKHPNSLHISNVRTVYQELHSTP